MKVPVIRLKIRVRRADGSRPFLNPVFAGNNKLKPGYALVNGKPEHHAEADYYLRYVRGAKRVLEPVGSDPQLDLMAKNKREKYLEAKAAGISVQDDRLNPELASPLIADVIDSYVRRSTVSRPATTVTNYRRMLNLFGESVGTIRLDKLTDEHMLRHIASLQALGLAPRTISNHFNRISTMLRLHGIKDILRKEDHPKYDEKEPDAYTRQELAALFQVADTEERLLFSFFLQTGFREREVMFCTWRDVDFDGQVIRVRAKRDMGFRIKDCEERSVPVPDSLIAALTERRQVSTSTLLFPARDGKPNGHYLRSLKRLALKSQINCGQCIDKQGRSCATHPVCQGAILHKFRRTFATMHHEAGVSARTIQRFLGHASLDVTLRYLAGADLRSDRIREQVNGTFSSVA